MKKTLFAFALTLSLGLSLNSSAQASSQKAPIGFDQFQRDLLNVSDPVDSTRKTYTLKAPKQRHGFNLVLLPEEAFEVNQSYTNENVFRVQVRDYELIYNMNRFHYTNGAILDFNDNGIGFRWVESGAVDPRVDGDAFVQCSMSVSFTRQGTTLDFELLNLLRDYEDFTYQINFDHSVLTYDQNRSEEENQFVFRRLNNNDTQVELVVTRPNGSIYYHNQRTLPQCPDYRNDGPIDDSNGDGNGSPSREPMTQEQRQQLRGAVTINFGERSRYLLTRRFEIDYRASLTNPFNRTIRCDIVLKSGVGRSLTNWEEVDQKTHRVRVAPKETTNVTGRIRAKRGRSGSNLSGLEWARYQEQRPAKNCLFVD